MRPTPKAPESAPVRRVGTLTLGVCLIACGVLFLCYFFVPHFNWDLALKIAPAESIVVKIAGNTKTVTYNGEVQSSVWPEAMERKCADAGIILL